MKNNLKFGLFVLILCSFVFIGNSVFASTTSGTIDDSAHYAWGENIGWVDFSKVTVTDEGLGSSAYGENIGWIDVSSITNNDGVLGGYAWGENIGWVDFSKVTIGTDGVFSGGAYGENIGWITFGTGTNKVMTDWRPVSERETTTTHHTSSGSYMPGYGPKANITPVAPTTPTTPETKFTFTKNLKKGMTDSDVKELQKFLNSKGFTVALTGAGSSGFETNLFGSLTQKALIKFQLANKIKPAVGFFGPITRGIINQLNK